MQGYGAVCQRARPPGEDSQQEGRPGVAGLHPDLLAAGAAALARLPGLMPDELTCLPNAIILLHDIIQQGLGVENSIQDLDQASTPASKLRSLSPCFFPFFSYIYGPTVHPSVLFHPELGLIYFYMPTEVAEFSTSVGRIDSE